ncbi:Calcium-responsive transcription factor [Paramuricea clavata]|uniref:Calcium-responsive transcription factor n=1 Tax=Paramuricea clavata TaxID=317549 RepID=A0A7D9JLG1_PARCT|nr:Calcium-responsive transcription factor [Paramuricea clavata]
MFQVNVEIKEEGPVKPACPLKRKGHPNMTEERKAKRKCPTDRSKVVPSTNLAKVDGKQKLVNEVTAFEWILKARTTENLNKILLTYGPVPVTLGNLCTIVPPHRLKKKDKAEIKKQLPKFVAGWLSGMIIEAELHRLEKEHPDCISANTSVEQLAVHEVKNTKRLWMNVDFATIKKIFVPMNPSGCHWNLLV